MPRYLIAPDESRVWIHARSTLHPIHSTAAGLEGFVDVGTDGRGPTAGELSFPVERLSGGNPLEEREMRRRIDARRYPTIDGRLTGAAPTQDSTRYVVRGEVTFRGVSRPCEDEMTIEVVDNRTLKLAGESRFDVRDFGMQPPRILMIKVEPDVTVRVEIVARAEE